MFEVIGIITSIWFAFVLVLSIKPIMKAMSARIEFDAFMAERMAAEAAKEINHAR